MKNYDTEIDKLKKNIAKNFKKMREKKGITQAEASFLSNVPPVTISAYERGKKSPSLVKAIQLAKAYECSLDSLCNYTPEDPLPPNPENLFSQTLFNLIIQLKATVHVEDKNIIFSLSSDNDCMSYSSYDILQFFKDYETIQNFNLSSPPPNMVSILKKNLVKQYKNLPRSVPYKYISKKTTAED